MMNRAPDSALSYAVRIRVVARYVGQLLIALAVLQIPPFVFALSAGVWDVSWRYTALIAVLAGVGAACGRFRAPPSVQRNEAFVIIAVTYLLSTLAGAFPRAAVVPWIDAWFETVSAITTTGLSTLPDIEAHSAVFQFSRAWAQWYGGLGIVILSLAVIDHRAIVGKRLGANDTQSTDLVAGARNYARRMLIIYGILTGAAIVALLACGVGPFSAILHAFAAVSTGGFSPYSDSLGNWEMFHPAPVIVILASVAGATPFLYYLRIWRDRWKALWSDPQVRMAALSGLAGALALCLAMRFGGGLSWQGAFWHGPLNAWSAMSTAGFSTLDLSEAAPMTKATMLPLMFVGGGVGSTAGGVKILRILIFVSVVALILKRTTSPERAVIPLRLGGNRLESKEIQEALAIIILSFCAALISWLCFVLGGYDPLDSLFEVVSSLATVGLSAGISSQELPAVLKAVLCVDMLLGRVEIIAFLVLLYPHSWIGRRRSYP